MEEDNKDIHRLYLALLTLFLPMLGEKERILIRYWLNNVIFCCGMSRSPRPMSLL